MEESKKKEPDVMVHTSRHHEVADQEFPDYVDVCFEDCIYYICSSHEFTSLLTGEGGSFIKEAAIQTSELLITIKSKGKVPPKELSANNINKFSSEEELEDASKVSLKRLMEVVDLNLIRDKLDNELQIGGQELEEEEKHFRESKIPFRRMNEDPMYNLKDVSENIDLYCPEEQMHESLLMRRKGQHLNEEQITNIIQQLERSPQSRKLLQRMYRLSRTTLRRIIQQKGKDKPMDDGTLARFEDKQKISREAGLKIRSYLLPPCEPRSIPAIKRHVEAELQETYSFQEIRSYIKKEMKYSYRKGSSRPPAYAKKRTQLMKTLFCTELLYLIANREVVINCDESSFDRTSKQQYSWLPIGKNCQIINDRLKGRASLILATWSTGEWLAMIVTSTVNSDKFCLFLKLLSTIIGMCFSNMRRSPTVVMDNASTHASGLTQEVIKRLGLRVQFGAPYCPEVAPVERIFGRIKSKLRASGGSTVVDFSKRKGVELIFRLINLVGKDSWVNAWREVIKEARKTIVEALERERCQSREALKCRLDRDSISASKQDKEYK